MKITAMSVVTGTSWKNPENTGKKIDETRNPMKNEHSPDYSTIKTN